MRKLSVIIVNYNVARYLQQCLLSLRAALAGIDAEVIVADNNSKDGSVALLQGLFPEVNFIALQHNLGFSRANNVALKQASGENVLYLNPDTIVGEDVVRHCLDFLDQHPDAGSLGVQMLHPDGTVAMESRRGVPSPLVAFYKMSGLCKRFPKSRRFAHYYMSYLPWDKPVEIEIVSGAYCMVSRKALDRVGPFDEDFFMYGEDIDLSYRLLKGGYHNWYLPERILHYKGESTERSSFRYVHVFYEAMLIFFRKHYGHLSFLLSLPIKAAILVKACMALAYTSFWRMRQQLGLLPKHLRNNNDDIFVFIGSKEMIEACHRIATRKGLNSIGYEGNAKTLPKGHLQLTNLFEKKQPQDRFYIVYDLSSYSRAEVLNIFAGEPKDNVQIGTYDPATGMLITEQDVYSYE